MSRESIADEILFASQQFTLYISFIILFGGIIGHTIDILVFTSSKPFRNTQSAFYLTIESIVNSIHLLLSFSSRIAINGFNNDLTRTSLAWCKIRSFVGSTCTFLSLIIVCLAAIDQYLATSYNHHLKQFSTLKLAQRVASLAIVLVSLHGIPFLILIRIDPIRGCVPFNEYFVSYITYIYYLILTGFLPICITSLFATLAYTNVRRIIRSQIPIVRRRLDKQLTAMILVRVVFLVTTTLPYIMYRIYSLKTKINSNNQIQFAIIQLVGSVTYSLFYLNYSV